MKFLIAIGHFGQPSVIQLQARAIRANVGDIPILVSDDYSETAFGGPTDTTEDRGKWVKERLLEVCKSEGLMFTHSGEKRLGHIGGDLGAFYHGLTYARDHAIDYVCKLSQRFVIDIPRWMHEITRQMGKFEYNTACAQCFYHQRSVFHMRTECVVMKTLPWLKVLPDLVPRELPYSTEHLIAECSVKIDGYNKLLAPPWLPENRHERHPGVAWKDNRPEDLTTADYRGMAAKYGVTLGEDFSIGHSSHLPGHLWGLKGWK